MLASLTLSNETFPSDFCTLWHGWNKGVMLHHTQNAWGASAVVTGFHFFDKKSFEEKFFNLKVVNHVPDRMQQCFLICFLITHCKFKQIFHFFAKSLSILSTVNFHHITYDVRTVPKIWKDFWRAKKVKKKIRSRHR